MELGDEEQSEANDVHVLQLVEAVVKERRDGLAALELPALGLARANEILGLLVAVDIVALGLYPELDD